MIIALVGLGMVSAADYGAVDTVVENDSESFIIGDDIVVDDVSVDNGNISDIPVVDENISDVPIVDENISDVPIVDENISDVPVVDENMSADVSVDDVNNTTEVIDQDDVIANETPVVEDVVGEENDKGHKIHNPKDLDVGIYLKMDMMYKSGYSTIEIGKEFNMSAEEVQSAVDEICILPITHEVADYVYKAYGTKTLAQMADELGTGTTKLNSYIRHLKNGYFGEIYQIILHNRDLHLLSQNKTQYIFEDI